MIFDECVVMLRNTRVFFTKNDFGNEILSVVKDYFDIIFHGYLGNYCSSLMVIWQDFDLSYLGFFLVICSRVVFEVSLFFVVSGFIGIYFFLHCNILCLVQNGKIGLSNNKKI